MSAPDPEGFSLLATLGSAASVVALPIIWLWTKLDKKADKHSVNGQFQEVKNELAYQRETQAKLFDQIRNSDQRAQDRHERLMESLTK